MTLRLMSLSLLTAAFCSLMSNFAAAHVGGSDTSGGDARCSEYVEEVGRVASKIASIPRSRLDDVSLAIQPADLILIKNTVKCLPVSTLDRQARSNRTTVTTQLLVSEWASLSAAQRERLATHELSVLAGYEGEGEYQISMALIALMKKENSEKLLLHCLINRQVLTIKSIDNEYVDIAYTASEHGPLLMQSDAKDEPVYLLKGGESITRSVWLEKARSSVSMDANRVGISVKDLHSTRISVTLKPLTSAPDSNLYLSFDVSNREFKKAILRGLNIKSDRELEFFPGSCRFFP